MKIQIASDLHLDRYRRAGLQCPFKVLPEADLLVLAGDVDVGLQGVDFARGLNVPALFIPGNWEHYAVELDDAASLMRHDALHSKVQVLQNEVAVVAGARFLGTTLWSDFKASRFSQESSMRRASLGMNDYRQILVNGVPAVPADTLSRHEASLHWLEHELSRHFDGPTVVVSHHAPHPNSIPRRWNGHPLEASYASRLTGLMKSVNLWVHGHVHAGCDYRINGCRVVCNPVGGPHPPRIPDSVANPTKPYDPGLLIEVT